MRCRQKRPYHVPSSVNLDKGQWPDILGCACSVIFNHPYLLLCGSPLTLAIPIVKQDKVCSDQDVL